MRLNKYIAHCGYCSRRKADIYISEGKVKVNGVKVNTFSYTVKENDKVSINDVKLVVEEKVYYKLNKPVGYICSNLDRFNKNKAIDLIKTKKRIYTAGRLDKDSSGLIILTNDGLFANKLIHPSSNIAKEYIVKLDRKLKQDDIQTFESKIKIDNRKIENAKIMVLNSSKFLYKVRIYEGLNRQIRRMFNFLDYEVRYLKRISIGNIELGKLNYGEYKKLSLKELEYIRNLK